MAALDEGLGRERALLFVGLEQEMIDDAFRHYGAEERILRVERQSSSGYRVVEERESTIEISVTPPAFYQNRTQLQGDFGRIVTLLPTDFIR